MIYKYKALFLKELLIMFNKDGSHIHKFKDNLGNIFICFSLSAELY